MSVPTCKYFARGTCRYGDRCRFYHPPGGGGGGGQQGFYGGQGDVARGGVYNQIQESRLKLNENVRAIEEMVKKDMIEWEKGKIWPFTCYGPTGNKPNLEGFEDISFEELRFATMQNNGVLPNNIPMRIQLWNRARAKWQQTTPENLAALEQLILGSEAASNSQFQQNQSSGGFGNTQTQSQFSGNNFTSSGPGFNQGVFGQNQNPALGNFSFTLSGNNAPNQSPNAMDAGSGAPMGSAASFSFTQAISQTQPAGFSSPSMQLQNTIGPQGFGSSNQSQQPAMSQGFPMGTQPQQSQNFAGQGFPMNAQNQQPILNQGFPSASALPTQNSLNPGFASTLPTQQGSSNPLSSFSFNMNQQVPTSNASAFSTNTAFGVGSMQSIFGPSSNPAGSNQSLFGQSGFNTTSGTATDMDAYENNIYSKPSDLTQEEIQAFEAPQFLMETIPLNAPAKKFCF